jgi:putative NIF3 family GTP cyclohydrolase 1 type 2
VFAHPIEAAVVARFAELAAEHLPADDLDLGVRRAAVAAASLLRPTPLDEATTKAQREADEAIRARDAALEGRHLAWDAAERGVAEAQAHEGFPPATAQLARAIEDGDNRIQAAKEAFLAADERAMRASARLAALLTARDRYALQREA